MRDDRDGTAESDRRSNTTTDAGDTPSADEGDATTRSEWLAVPDDPTPEALGYGVHEWESFRALDGADQVMFLPAEEAALRDDEFIVVTEDSVVELDGRA